MMMGLLRCWRLHLLRRLPLILMLLLLLWQRNGRGQTDGGQSVAGADLMMSVALVVETQRNCIESERGWRNQGSVRLVVHHILESVKHAGRERRIRSQTTVAVAVAAD